jgi:hypothetical protein
MVKISQSGNIFDKNFIQDFLATLLTELSQKQTQNFVIF